MYTKYSLVWRLEKTKFWSVCFFFQLKWMNGWHKEPKQQQRDKERRKKQPQQAEKWRQTHKNLQPQRCEMIQNDNKEAKWQINYNYRDAKQLQRYTKQLQRYTKWNKPCLVSMKEALGAFCMSVPRGPSSNNLSIPLLYLLCLFWKSFMLTCHSRPHSTRPDPRGFWPGSAGPSDPCNSAENQTFLLRLYLKKITVTSAFCVFVWFPNSSD